MHESKNVAPTTEVGAAVVGQPRHLILLGRKGLRRLGNSALLAGVLFAVVFFVLFLKGLTPFSRFREIGGWAVSHGFWLWWYGLCGLGLLLFRILFGNPKIDRYGEYADLDAPIDLTFTARDIWRVPLLMLSIVLEWVFLFSVVQFPWVVLSIFLHAVSIR